MAAHHSPAEGRKGDKLWRDAIMRAIKREEIDAASGERTKRLEMLADKLVERALDGDMAALKEIGDRIDGKTIQPIAADTTSEITYRIELIDLSDGEPKIIDVTPNRGNGKAVA